MGPVASCIRSQPRYPVLAPPMQRRAVKKAEIMRPPTMRLQTITERAITLDAVSPTASQASPCMLKATDSTVAWVKLEGKFSMDADEAPVPLSKKLASQFRKQNHEAKTLEDKLFHQNMKKTEQQPDGTSSNKDSDCRKTGSDFGQADTSNAWIEKVEKADQPTVERNETEDEGVESSDALDKLVDQASLFKESLSVVENQPPVRNENRAMPSVEEAIAKFDVLGRQAIGRETRETHNDITRFVTADVNDENSSASDVREESIENPSNSLGDGRGKSLRKDVTAEGSPRAVSEGVPA